MNRDQIREVFLAHGFNVKPGRDDLKPYIYEAAEALLALAATEAAEPVAPTITLTARQIRNALDFVAPDFDKEADERETELSIAWGEAGCTQDDEGNPDPAGYRCWLTDYPEEGSIPLIDEYPSSIAGLSECSRPPAPTDSQAGRDAVEAFTDRQCLLLSFAIRLGVQGLDAAVDRYIEHGAKWHVEKSISDVRAAMAAAGRAAE